MSAWSLSDASCLRLFFNPCSLVSSAVTTTSTLSTTTLSNYNYYLLTMFTLYNYPNPYNYFHLLLPLQILSRLSSLLLLFLLLQKKLIFRLFVNFTLFKINCHQIVLQKWNYYRCHYKLALLILPFPTHPCPKTLIQFLSTFSNHPDTTTSPPT